MKASAKTFYGIAAYLLVSLVAYVFGCCTHSALHTWTMTLPWVALSTSVSWR